MRHRGLTVVLVASAVLLASPALDACGDKFFRAGYMLGRAAHPASILIYMPPGSIVPAAAKELQLFRELSAAGHRVRSVERAEDLQAALKSGSFDIVVGDPGARTALDQMPAGKAKPRFLPVFQKPSKPQLAAAEKTFRHVLATPAKRHLALIEVDHVMEEQRKGMKAGL